MKEIIFIILISIFAASSSFLSAGKVIDKRRKGLKIIKLRGWTMICLNLGIIILSIFQFNKNRNDIKIKETEAISVQHKRDSILKSYYDSSLYKLKLKFDTSNIKTVSTVSNILGKYGFMLDSTNKKLIKLVRDSSKTKIISANDPVLGLDLKNGISLYEVKNGIKKFRILICSLDAGSTGFELSLQYLLEDSLNRVVFKDIIIPVFPNDIRIAKDDCEGPYFDIPDNIDFKLMYFLIYGKYTNLDGSKIYNVNELYCYNSKTKAVAPTMGNTKLEILMFMKKYKTYK